jgi:hypothetical protein
VNVPHRIVRHRFPRHRRALLWALVSLALCPVVLDAVLVAPHAIFMDHRTRTGQFTIANPGDVAEDVEITLQFGYPATDSLGNPYVVLLKVPGANQPSAARWIQAFPRRVRLEPGQRQVVRLLATPPADLPDGEYWTRVIATSRRVSRMGAAPDSGLQAGLTFELRTIIGLLYRKGTPRTAIRLRDVRGSTQGDSLVVWSAVERDGDAAYLGTAHIRVADDAGLMIREWRVPIAVYYSLRRRLAFPLEQIAPGRYTVHVTFTTLRDDVPQSAVLPAPTVADSFTVHIR